MTAAPALSPPACLTTRLARRLELLIVDVDGTLTDGALWFGPRGETLKRFHVRDGRGIQLLQHSGIQVALVSGRRSPAVAARARELGLTLLLQGMTDKSRALDRLLDRLALSDTQVACVGDDTPDIPLFARVAFAVAVHDAHPLAARAAHCRTTLPGGHGAVREVCDWLLAARSRA